MLQVNRHAHLVEQIHTEDAVNRPAAGRTDGVRSIAGNLRSRSVCFPTVSRSIFPYLRPQPPISECELITQEGARALSHGETRDFLFAV
jgi:hypothetical protein